MRWPPGGARVDAFGLFFGGLALLLAAACTAIVALSGDGAQVMLGLVPVAVYAWLARPARIDRRGFIGLGLATAVLLVFVAAWAAGGDGWPGVAAAAAGILVADSALWLVARMAHGTRR